MPAASSAGILNLFVEPLALPRHLPQQSRRTQALAVPVGVAFQLVHHPAQTLAIRLAQQAAAEWGEAEAEDDADVDVCRVGDDALLLVIASLPAVIAGLLAGLR
jgi:mannose/fructose/N-acetylgalactosamine-specific phosphotransferase system component IIC